MSRQHDSSSPAPRYLAQRRVGEVLDGTVVEIVPFGVFVEVAEGVHGLVHESESAARPAPGTPMRVEVLAVDAEAARMSLRPA